MKPTYLRSEVFSHLGLRIRPIQSSDKQKLANGFARLSAESRYQRFFGQKNVLTAEELRRFTEFDGHDHFALGAFELSGTGEEGDAVGVARFLRLAEDPEVAELGIAVTDDKQGRGIGRLLLQRLLLAATDSGVKRIRCYVLADNERMRNLAERVLGRATLRREGPILVGDFPIPDTVPVTVPASATGTKAWLDFLRLMADSSVTLPAICTLATLKHRLKTIEANLAAFNDRLRSRA